MNSKNEAACCGIYCPDCIHYKNRYSIYAQQLKTELEKIEFVKYAETESPFGKDFKKYSDFIDILNALSGNQCDKICREGNGCSGKPCKIMECCISRGYEGCWECSELEDCRKFDFLEPRCGDMPKNNLKKIKKHGIMNWINQRDKFYIWQK